MTLVASKPSYEPGDTARLVAQANLVAADRARHDRARRHPRRARRQDGRARARASSSRSPTRGRRTCSRRSRWCGPHGDGDRNRPQFKMGLVELKVASAHKQLDVAVTLDRDHVRPGEPVTGKIHVAHDGQPVKAEVSLSAADEGVLQLIAYETPNPMKTFYAAYGLGVDDGTSWNRIARLADPEAGDPDEGGDRRSAGDGQRVRCKFVASAYWAPMLVTDDHGDIAFSFTAPDNLTAFRLMAVAADAGERFGAGELRLTVDKPLMAVPALPRFLTAGDTAVGRRRRSTTTPISAGTATVTASATGVVARREVARASACRRTAARACGSPRRPARRRGRDVRVRASRSATSTTRSRVTIPIGAPRTIEHPHADRADARRGRQLGRAISARAATCCAPRARSRSPSIAAASATSRPACARSSSIRTAASSRRCRGSCRWSRRRTSRRRSTTRACAARSSISSSRPASRR